MKRKLKSFGFLNPDVRKGVALTDELSLSIYKKLKDIGFRETHWQYVYEGQLAGLVMPYKCGINEIHIRFYSNRCFAELEIGRALISHFFGPQYNAKKLIETIVEPHLNSEERCHLKSLLEGELKADEKLLPYWRESVNRDPYAVIIRRVPSIGSSLKSYFAGLGWKAIAFYILPAASVIFMIPSFELVWGFFGVASVISGIVLPAVGKP